MSYALERLVEHAAFELGIDPAEFRRKSFIPKDKFPIASPPASSTTAAISRP